MTNARVQEALKILTEEGYVWKVWSNEDVLNRIAEMREHGYRALEDIPTGEDERIAEEAANSRCFKVLGDCTESDWDMIDDAIFEVLEG